MREKLDKSKLPAHIGIIIDGNGRWAKKRNLARIDGHLAGVKKLSGIIEYVFNLGIRTLSIYCFSTENWNRPKVEVDYLLDLFRKYVPEIYESTKKLGVKIVCSGDIKKFPSDLQEIICNVVTESSENTNYTLNLCLNYGGRSEIVNACNKAVKEGKFVDEKSFEEFLYNNLPPLDLVIRTSGEIRISNFMLWQIAYSELYFTKTFWPDFSRRSLERALIDYQKRNRRFGAIKES